MFITFLESAYFLEGIGIDDDLTADSKYGISHVQAVKMMQSNLQNT